MDCFLQLFDNVTDCQRCFGERTCVFRFGHCPFAGKCSSALHVFPAGMLVVECRVHFECFAHCYQEVELTAPAPAANTTQGSGPSAAVCSARGSLGRPRSRPTGRMHYWASWSPRQGRVLTARWRGYHVGAHRHSLSPGMLFTLVLLPVGLLLLRLLHPCSPPSLHQAGLGMEARWPHNR